MIPFPRILMHKVQKLPRKDAAAFHLGPLGIWYTDKTLPEMLEQEKAEAWWVTIAILLSCAILWALWGSWWALLAATPVLVYPGPYYLKYPGSVHFRRYFEIRSHAIEYRAFVRIMARNQWSTTGDLTAWISNRAWMMSRHEFYDLKWTYAETHDALYTRCLR